MNLFVQPTSAPSPKTPIISYASIGLAAIFVILAVAQLYSFEEYPDVIESMSLPTMWPPSLYAALIVTLEVLAVPFLLGMRLSPAMRVASMVAGWLVISTWLKISLFLNVSVNAVTNSGALGATIPVAPGWWMVYCFGALAVVVAWVSWGMWPMRSQKRSTHKSSEG